jgi:class 3 adenylate cyclase
LRLSIAIKIFFIVLALLLLMTAVAFISLQQARKVGDLLERAAEGYIPAYAALARTDIRGLEQALALRRLVIIHLEGGDVAAEQRHRATFEAKQQEAERELAAARKVIADEIAAETAFADAIALARLDTKLELLQQARGPYDAAVKDLFTALASGNNDATNSALDRVDTLRDDIKARLEETRDDMRQLLQAAVERARAQHRRVEQISIVVTVLAGLIGLGLAAAMTAALVRPVRRLLAGTRAVESGSLDIEIPVTSTDEIGRLTVAFNRMVSELRAKAKIRDMFGKYVDPRIVEGLIERPGVTAGEGERRVMTIFFCDLKGFSALGENLTPKNLVAVTNRYLTVMSEPVHAQGGILDKYIGDTIMAYWGPPFTDPAQHAGLACRAALDLVDRVAPFLAELPELTGVRRGLPDVGMRIGISTGQVLVGNIGSDTMKSYTVMGGPVNLAARLEGANKHYGTAILVNEATAAAAIDAVETREIDTVIVLGAREPEKIFEVMARKGALSETRARARALYAEGLAAYRSRNWDLAQERFTAVLAIDPADGASQALLARMDGWRHHPPGADWDGAWRLMDK